MPNLVTLSNRTRYLKDIEIGPKGVRQDEIEDAQEYADNYIEGKLGTIFAAPNIPKMIEKIADMLASSHVLRFAHNLNSPKKSERATELKEEAQGLVKEILDGCLGLVMADGSFHPDYPGISKSVDENEEEDEIEILK